MYSSIPSLFLMNIDYTILDAPRDSEIELSILESYGDVAFFFFDEIQTIRRSSNYGLEGKMNLITRNVIDTLTTSPLKIPLMEKYLKDPQSILQASPTESRCFYSQTRKFQCERCLSVHSITFALHAYTFKSQRRGFIFVFAFTSLYGHRRIQKACALKYCTA